MEKGRCLLFRNWLLCFVVLCFASLSLGICPVFAQDDGNEFMLEEIVVTGSRIVRNNNESVSPIVTVDQELFDQSTTSAIETVLNKLPQFTPTMDIPQAGGADIQPSATNSPGEANVALRGLGANRTLTLINGRRGMPSNASGVIDINTIPTAAVQYMEAISGGASSTYGADAMAGVLNFVMKDHYEGMEINAQIGITEEGDNLEYNISGVMGSNFKDDRGNIMMSFAYNERKDALQRDRDWYRDNWKNPAIAGSGTWMPYPGVNLWYANHPDVNVLNEVMELPEGEGFGALGGAVIYVHPSGQVFSGFDNNGRPGIPAAEALGVVDGFEVKQLNNGNLGKNNIDTYLIFPLERWNFYSQGNYELNDYVGVFGQAYFSKTSTRTIMEGGIIANNQTVEIDPTRNREVIPGELLTILDSRNNPDAPFRMQALMPNDRDTHSETVTFNITTGLEGAIPGLDNWTWEAFLSYGEAENTVEQRGMYSLERLRGVMGGVMSYDYDEATNKYTPVYWPDYKNFGQGLVLKGNEEYANNGGATATCTSGLNPFDWDSVTQDCWDAVEAPLKNRQLMQQTIWEANVQGPIANLPMGEMRGAFGVSHRAQDYKYVSDNLNTEGRSWNDKILGLNPVGEAKGNVEVTEGYAELLIPLVKELPFAEQVDLNIGGRLSDYNTTGESNTYKAQLDWRANSFLRFRGGYNRAERAPNIGELYTSRTMTFGAMSYGDVCSMRNDQVDWSANSGANDNWLDIVALCGRKMDETGNPDADTEYFGADWQEIVDYVNAHPGTTTDDEAGPNTIHGPDENNDGIADNGAPILTDDFDDMPTGGFAWLWPIQMGNPDLEPETADTYTVGIVLDSFVQDIPWLSNWRISVDYYTIKIEDAIGLQSSDVVLQMCTDPTFNPTFDPNSSLCTGIERKSDTGGLGNVTRTYYNNGRFRQSGIDFSINWSMDAGPGRIGVNSRINYLLEMKSSELLTNPLIDYVGTFDPSENGLNGNSAEWRALTTFRYAMDNWDVSLRWQFTDGLENVSGNNTPLDPYHMFDLLGNYQLMDNVRLRFGIENVFNIEPDLYNEDLEDANGMTGGTFNNRTQDLNGRRFYVGMKVHF